MSRVVIRLVNSEKMHDFYFTEDIVGLAKQLRAGHYVTAATLLLTEAGEEAAEEAFDLTNNPMRRDQRAEVYGRQRSVSVGDIVTVDGTDYLCAPVGWLQLV